MKKPDYIKKLVVEYTKADEETYFVITKETPDLINDIVIISGVDLTNFTKVLWNHKMDELPIGKPHNPHPKTDEILSAIKYSPDEFSQQVKKMVDGGFLKSVSIGFFPLEKPIVLPLTKEMKDSGQFYPGDSVRIFPKIDLREFSLVNFPMHPDAQMVENSFAIEDVEKELGKDSMLYKSMTEKFFEPSLEVKTAEDKIIYKTCTFNCACAVEKSLVPVVEETIPEEEPVKEIDYSKLQDIYNMLGEILNPEEEEEEEEDEPEEDEVDPEEEASLEDESVVKSTPFTEELGDEMIKRILQ